MFDDLYLFTGFPESLTSENPYCFKLTWVGPGYNNESGTIPNITNICEAEDDFCTTPWVVTRKHRMFMSFASFNASVKSVFKF
jgi:hypothetical protein